MYCLKILWAKVKCIGATFNVVFLAAIVWSRYTTPLFPVIERARWQWNLIDGIQFMHLKNCSSVIGNVSAFFFIVCDRCKLFGVCVWEIKTDKTPLNLKNDATRWMQTFHIPINLDLNRRGSFEGHISLHLSNESKISGLCHSLSTAP